MTAKKKYNYNPYDLISLCKRNNSYAELKDELEDIMHCDSRERIKKQLMFEHVNIAPVLKTLKEKFIGINLGGFEELINTTVTAAFAYGATKVGEATLRTGLRQYLENTPKNSNCYLILTLDIPEYRESMIEYINKTLSPESDLIYEVDFHPVSGEQKEGHTYMNLLFHKDGLCVFNEFWESRPGKFFIAKYNDYLLN